MLTSKVNKKLLMGGNCRTKGWVFPVGSNILEWIYQGKWARKTGNSGEMLDNEILGVDHSYKHVWVPDVGWRGQSTRQVMDVSSINRYTVELVLDSILFHKCSPNNDLICNIFINRFPPCNFFLTSYLSNHFIQLQNKVLWNSDRSLVIFMY